MKDISIIIPTKNNEDVIENCLKSIADLDYPADRKEVIIVDGHSIDSTLKIVEKYGCKIVFEDVGNQAGAYNAGIKNAEGEYLVFTDADCVVPKGWLRSLVRSFDGEGIASVGGPNLTPDDDTTIGKCVGQVLGLLSKVGARYGLNANKTMETFHNPTCNVAYRREVMEKVGGFNQKLITCADEELDYRIKEIGYKILYVPDATVLHYRKSSYKSFLIQAYKYAVGRMQAIKLHRKMAKWFHCAPSLIALFVLFLMILSPINSIYFLILMSVLITGGLGISAMSLYLAATSKARKMRNFVRFFVLISSWFWAFAIGFLVGATKSLK